MNVYNRPVANSDFVAVATSGNPQGGLGGGDIFRLGTDYQFWNWDSFRRI